MHQSLELVKTELDINLPLLQGGDVSKAEVLKLQRQVAEIQGLITNRKNKYRQDSQTDLSKALEELAGIEQIMAQRKDQLKHTVVASPMDGVVRNIRITTRGGVARPGEEIMQIVPIEDDLLIEAKVKPADIAFVKPGLPTTIKLDAYDYTIYGSLQGTVSYISADTMSDESRAMNEPAYYRVQVKTKASDIARHAPKRIEILPGMTASVEIRTGSNTVWKYLTKPITKTMTESLGER
jgi:adhesin transport system membrane fusion protein